MTKGKKITSVFAVLVLVAALALFLAVPKRASESVFKGLSLWAACVLPATLPFLFFSALLTRMKAFSRLSAFAAPAGKLFRISGAGVLAFLLSALSGYPVGARTVADLFQNGQLKKEETFRAAALASAAGPMFLVGAVGAGMFQSAKAGRILLISHLSAILVVCFFLRFPAKNFTPVSHLTPPAEGNALAEGLAATVSSATLAGVSVAVFFAVADLVSGAVPDLPYLKAAVAGLIEMTSGCALCAGLGTVAALSLSCFFVTFGGACVLIQQLAFLTKAGVRPLPFLFVKFLQGVLSGAICFGLALLFGI